MNARKTKKRLKKQISKLESDNALMHRIIEDSPKMQELYNVYTEPLNHKVTTIRFQEFKAKRMLLVYMTDVEGIIKHTKQAVVKDLFECIKDNITYEVDTECMTPTITASILVGRK